MKICIHDSCSSTIIAGRCRFCRKPLCGRHLSKVNEGGLHICMFGHIMKGEDMKEKDITSTVTQTKEEVFKNQTDPVRCWLCNTDDAWVFRGLATLGIEYPGPTRFICDTCIGKVKRA